MNAIETMLIKDLLAIIKKNEIDLDSMEEIAVDAAITYVLTAERHLLDYEREEDGNADEAHDRATAKEGGTRDPSD